MATFSETVRYDEVHTTTPYTSAGSVSVGPSGNITLTTANYLSHATLDLHLRMYTDSTDTVGVKIPKASLTGAVSTEPGGLIVRGLTPGLIVRFVVTNVGTDTRAKVTVSLFSDGE